MATNSPLPYVSEIYEDVFSSKIPVKPRPKRILILSFVLSVFTYILLSMFLNKISKTPIKILSKNN